MMTPTPPDRRPPLVPSHIAWPAFIILLLTMSIVAGVGTLILARSDGGARVIESVEAGP